MSGEDVVFQVCHGFLGILGLVKYLGDRGSPWPGGLPLGKDLVNRRGNGDDILAGSFFDRNIYRLETVEPGTAGLFLKTVQNNSDILKIDRIAVMGGQDQAVDFFGGGEFSGHPELHWRRVGPG